MLVGTTMLQVRWDGASGLLMLSRQMMDVLRICVQDGTSVGILVMTICAFRIYSQAELGVTKIIQAQRTLGMVYQQSGLGCALAKTQTVGTQNQFLRQCLVLSNAPVKKFGMVQHVQVAKEAQAPTEVEIFSKFQALAVTLHRCTQAVMLVVVMLVVWV